VKFFFRGGGGILNISIVKRLFSGGCGQVLNTIERCLLLMFTEEDAVDHHPHRKSWSYSLIMLVFQTM
jgi:hypothetical protein